VGKLLTFFKRVGRYWNTIRYLRLIQITERITRKFKRIHVDLSVHMGINHPNSHWIMPATRHQRMMNEQTFCFLNESHEVLSQSDWNNERWEKLWLYNLHYFDDLNSFDAKNRVTWHRKIINRWIMENPVAQGNGWEPYPSSLRIVNWIKWSLVGNELDDQWKHSLVIQVRFLSKNLETHILGNHLFTNAKSLVFAGVFFNGEEAENWYHLGSDILEKELPEQILADGGNFELSPMYHAIILEDLLDIINLHRAFGRSVSPQIESVIPKMIDWLIAMCHPDGEISFFNDAAIAVTPSVSELINYAEQLGYRASFEQTDLLEFNDTGYSRVSQKDVVAIIDHAMIGPDYLPSHAHADTLSFELSLFGKRVIVNSGTSMYGKGVERQRQRGTAAHSTVVIDEHNSSDVWGGFRVAKRAKAFGYEAKKSAHNIRLSAYHDGYKHLSGKIIHGREWCFTDNLLEINDKMTGSGKHKIEVVFCLHPDIKIMAVNKQQVTLDVAGNSVELTFIGKGFLTLLKSTYHPEFGLAIENDQLIYQFNGDIPVDIKTRIQW
jgi:uncharacterized heparinase superfamily protein